MSSKPFFGSSAQAGQGVGGGGVALVSSADATTAGRPTGAKGPGEWLGVSRLRGLAASRGGLGVGSAAVADPLAVP